MATANGHSSDTEGMFVSPGPDRDPVTEPPLFTFQSDLSDDDLPDPLALNEIASATLATLHDALGLSSSPVGRKKKTEKKKEKKEKATRGKGKGKEKQKGKGRGKENEPTAPRPPTTTDLTRPWGVVRTNGAAAAAAAAVATTTPPAETPADKPRRKVPARVEIEVRLPWLSLEQRGEYETVEVEEYRPGEKELRRKRRGVSYALRRAVCCVLVCWVGGWGCAAGWRGGDGARRIGHVSLECWVWRGREQGVPEGLQDRGPRQVRILLSGDSTARVPLSKAARGRSAGLACP